MSFNWKKCEDELPELIDWISDNGVKYKVSITCIVIVGGEPDIGSYGSIIIDDNYEDGSIIGWKTLRLGNEDLKKRWNKITDWCYFEWPEKERK